MNNLYQNIKFVKYKELNSNNVIVQPALHLDVIQDKYKKALSIFTTNYCFDLDYNKLVKNADVDNYDKVFSYDYLHPAVEVISLLDENYEPIYEDFYDYIIA